MATETTNVLKGMLRSKLIWLGTAALALPDLLPLISPALAEILDAAAYKRLMQFLGVLVIIFRFYTSKPLEAKGAEADKVPPAPKEAQQQDVIIPTVWHLPEGMAVAPIDPKVAEALVAWHDLQKKRAAQPRTPTPPAPPAAQPAAPFIPAVRQLP